MNLREFDYIGLFVKLIQLMIETSSPISIHLQRMVRWFVQVFKYNFFNRAFIGNEGLQTLTRKLKSGSCTAWTIEKNATKKNVKRDL